MVERFHAAPDPGMGVLRRREPDREGPTGDSAAKQGGQDMAGRSNAMDLIAQPPSTESEMPVLAGQIKAAERSAMPRRHDRC